MGIIRLDAVGSFGNVSLSIYAFLVLVNWCGYTYHLIHSNTILFYFFTHQWSVRLVRDCPSLYLPNTKPPNVHTCVIIIWTPFSVFHPSKFLDWCCMYVLCACDVLIILTKLIQFPSINYFIIVGRHVPQMRPIKLAAINDMHELCIWLWGLVNWVNCSFSSVVLVGSAYWGDYNYSNIWEGEW